MVSAYRRRRVEATRQAVEDARSLRTSQRTGLRDLTRKDLELPLS
jgi:hypothetical protein